MIVVKPAKILFYATVIVVGQLIHAADDPVVPESLPESALEISVFQQQEISEFRQRLSELESEFGVYDQRLLETLQGLTDALIEAGDFEQANSLLDRRLLLLRTIDGPASPDQLPVIAELINNKIRQQDWRSVTEQFEYIYWLQSQDENSDTLALLNARNDVIDWLLTSVYLDNPRTRVRRFQDARQLQRENLLLAESSYQEDSPDLIPWLYKHATMLYQVYAFLVSRDELGFDARDLIQRIEGRSGGNYLREGLNTMKRIRKIVETQADPEAEAMAMIAEADFQMLLQLGTAARLYRLSMEKLQEAGIAEERIASFFQLPVVLPVGQFHSTLQSALDEQASIGYIRTTDQNPGEAAGGGEAISRKAHIGDFVAWNQSLPFIHRPPVPQLAASVSPQLDSIEFIFSVNSRGRASNPKAIDAEGTPTRLIRDGRDAVRDIQFRPRFVGGRWRRAEDVTMRYLFQAK